MRRYYALLLEKPGTVAIVRVYDDEVTRLAETHFEWDVDTNYRFELQVHGQLLLATIDGAKLLEVTDGDTRLDGGCIAYVVDAACILIEKLVKHGTDTAMVVLFQ